MKMATLSPCAPWDEEKKRNSRFEYYTILFLKYDKNKNINILFFFCEFV